MCGICGKISLNETPDKLEIKSMLHAIRHRGPDGIGIWGDDRACLGHVRLAIMDPAGGHQPVISCDGSTVAVVNGEFYNYYRLKKELTKKGHIFKTGSDSEVLLHLWQRYGTSCLQLLEGMFALALWNRNDGTLLLARDRIGQKPLYYASIPHGIAFASELKALLTLPEINGQLDYSIIPDYLTLQYIPGTRTGVRGIHKLPPATMMIFRNRRINRYRYWFPVPAHTTSVNEIGSALHDAVKDRLMSDVPLGAFLSGGIDSSVIVALMSGLAGKIKTFTAIFDEKQWDESTYARQVADHLGTEHHEIRIKPDIFEAIPSLLHVFDEPFGDPSAVPVWYISREASRYVKVVLSGDGGDEVFAGYERYLGIKYLKYARIIPHFMRWSIRNYLNRIRDKSVITEKFSRWIGASLEKPGWDYLRLMNVFWPEHLEMLLSPELFGPFQKPGHKYASCFSPLYRNKNAPGYTVAREAARGRLPVCDDIVSRLARADLLTYLPGDILTKVDRASMAHGLEIRSPFLDHRLIEIMLGVSGNRKMGFMKNKQILRSIAGPLLPPAIMHRAKKGFGLPISAWFRGSLKSWLYDTMKCSRLVDSGIISQAGINTMMQEHQSLENDHAHRLWALLMLELWIQSNSIRL